MAIIPSYELYGEKGGDLLPDILHCESIALRSRAHAGVIRSHRHHGLYQVLLARSGAMQARIGENRFQLSGGFMVLLPPMTVHGFEIDAATEGWVVTFPVASVHNLFSAVPGLEQLLESPLVRTHRDVGPEFEQLQQQVRLIEREFSAVHPGRQYALQSILDIFMIHLARVAARSDVTDLNVHNRKTDRVGRLLSLIEQHYREHLPAAAYAEKLGVTATHLNRLCREVLGRNTSQLIHDRLLMEAKRNLVYTSMSIAEVAAILGYIDTAYFSRFFFRKAGLTPVRYRQQRQHDLLRSPPSRAVRPVSD